MARRLMLRWQGRQPGSRPKETIVYADNDGTLKQVGPDGNASDVGGPGGSQPAVVKEPCAAATTEDVTLSGLQTVDFYPLQEGDRVLVLQQAAPEEDGIYVASAGAWTRATDADAEGDFSTGNLVPMGNGGNSYSDGLFVLTVTVPPWVPGVSTDLVGICVAGTQLLTISGVDPMSGVTTLTLGGSVLQVGATVNLTGGVTNVSLLMLPTSDPGVPGALWNNAGTPAIS